MLYISCVYSLLRSSTTPHVAVGTYRWYGCKLVDSSFASREAAWYCHICGLVSCPYVCVSSLLARGRENKAGILFFSGPWKKNSRSAVGTLTCLVQAGFFGCASACFEMPHYYLGKNISGKRKFRYTSIPRYENRGYDNLLVAFLIFPTKPT